MEKTNASEKKQTYVRRIIRPLIWWFVLVLVLFGIRTHQRLREQTRLIFAVTLQGVSVDYAASARLDGRPVNSGEPLPIGAHTFSVSHPKGVSFSTNFSVLYGRRDFGTIDLKRAEGTLHVEANPPAASLSIRGPELQLVLTNSAGTNLLVPTDNYVIEAKYKYWEKLESVGVSELSKQTARFNPQLGQLQLSCDQENASFQLEDSNGRSVEAGRFPSTLVGLPEGSYQVIAEHHGHHKTTATDIRADSTNDLKIEFVYGAAVFETEPSGATVWGEGRQNWGKTPLKLSELEPGIWKFAVRLDGYEPVDVDLQIAGNATNRFKTNLVSTSYVGAISAAQRFLSAADYSHAQEAASAALRIQPGDSVATGLKRKAFGLENLVAAQEFGKQGDYIAGIEKLTLAVEALPDNEEAKRLLAEFERRKPEQIEKMRVERLNRPKKTFEEVLAKLLYADLFQTHEFKSSKPYSEVETAIRAEFQSKHPEFKLNFRAGPKPETFFIEAIQEFSTYLATSAGRRQCIIVGGQSKDDETQIFFKIVEYKTEAQIKFSIGNLIGTPMAVDYVPIHPSRGAVTEKLQARLTEGVSNVTAIVQAAIGQTPVISPVPKL